MSKKVTMMIQSTCPYCRRALGYIEELKAGDPRYAAVSVETVDELLHPVAAAKLDYWYVPTFYIGGTKLHEGAADKSAVKKVLDAALSD